MMKKFLLIICIIFGSKALKSQCNNGNLEAGNLSNWNLFFGNHSVDANFNDITPGQPLQLNLFNSGSPAGRHTIVGTGSDPNIPAIPTVINGNFAMRLGDLTSGGNSEIASFTFTVPASKFFKFSFAMVLEPGHPNPNVENPKFQFWISKSSNLGKSRKPFNLLLNKSFIADPNDPFFSSGPNGLQYRNWQQECIDLSKFKGVSEGDQLTVYFLTSDCFQTGHMGYAYIDGLCEEVVKPNFTIPSFFCNVIDPVIADGSASLNVNRHFWEVVEVDPNNYNNIYTGTGQSSVQMNGPVGQFNINGLLTVKNGVTQVFRVTLVAIGCDGSFVKYNQYITIKTPNLQASDVIFCCGDKPGNLVASITYGKNGKIPNNIKFSWYDEAGNFMGNGNTTALTDWNNLIYGYSSSITSGNNYSGKYTVIYSDGGNCKAKATVYQINLGRVWFEMKNRTCWPNNTSVNEDRPINSPCLVQYDKIRVIYNLVPCNRFDKWAYDNIGLWMQYAKQYIEPTIQFKWNDGSTKDRVDVVNAKTTYTCDVSYSCGGTTTKNTLSLTYDPTIYSQALPSAVQNKLWAPTGFTPNGDGKNDCLVFYDTRLPAKGDPYAYSAFGYRLLVFDRWGNKIYDSGKVVHLCGGFYNGEIKWCPTGLDLGTYFYELCLMNCSDENNYKLVMKGDITAVN